MSTESENRTELAEDRTDLAQDRTLLANERTYSGWMRTGLASIGIGLAFNALFNRLEPVWFPKLIATLFVVLSIIIFQLARRKAISVLARMSANQVSPFPVFNISLIAHLMSTGAVLFLIVIWFFDWHIGV